MNILKNRLIFGALVGGGVLITAFFVSAQNIFDITYPIAELGNCESQSTCKVYCDEPANQDACQTFAESKGLVKKTERPRVDEEKRGPGGCKNATECRAYCDDEANFDECMNFAEKEGFMTKEEIARARKFRNQTGPGGCKGEACKNYCDEPGHEEECLAFAEKEGLIPKEEIARARKFLNASKDGGPGGCRGRQCENYCNDPAHRDECFEFAKKQGLIDEKEIENIERGKKLEEKVKEAGGPGGCKDEKSCMEYCKDPAHVEECLGFASAHGGMDRDTAERMLKQFVDDGERFGPRPVGRPGEFQPQRGGIEERLRKFEDFEKMEKEFRGEREFPDRPREPQEGSPSDGERPGVPYRTGPGGCKTPDECMKYCFEHRDECGLKEPPREGQPPREGEPRVGPPIRPDGKPFEQGEFRPEGRPFQEGEFRPEGRPFETGGPPQRPNVGPPPEGRYEPLPGNIQPPPEGFRPPEGEQRPAEQQFREQYQQQYQQPPPPPADASPPPPPPPPTTFNRAVEVVANILFAPVSLVEALLR